jgi:hypothetical protein
LGLRGEAAIAGANVDASMCRPLAMKLNEVLSVEYQDGAPVGEGVVQDLRIADALKRSKQGQAPADRSHTAQCRCR